MLYETWFTTVFECIVFKLHCVFLCIVSFCCFIICRCLVCTVIWFVNTVLGTFITGFLPLRLFSAQLYLFWSASTSSCSVGPVVALHQCFVLILFSVCFMLSLIALSKPISSSLPLQKYVLNCVWQQKTSFCFCFIVFALRVNFEWLCKLTLNKCLIGY